MIDAPKIPGQGSFVDQINVIGDDLLGKWIPELWFDSSRIIATGRIGCRDIIMQAIARPAIRKFQEPRVLNPKEQATLAAVIAGSKAFSQSLPAALAGIKLSLNRAWLKAAQDAYERICGAWAAAYDKHTPDGARFVASISGVELMGLAMMRYEGLTYIETLDAIFSGLGLCVKAAVLAAVAAHGSSTIAQRAVLDRFAGMFSKIEKDVEAAFREFLLATDKQAERAMTIIKRR